jgi:hypothetical protein
VIFVDGKAHLWAFTPPTKITLAERSAEGCAEHPYGGASKTLFLVAVSAACTILEERDQPFALFQRPDK